jgi:glyoxylase-like metal-dependent hydrolase (beta-lactamase superfamily II)
LALKVIPAGTGGQFQPTAGAMIANMAAAGIKPAQITRVIVSHFHPDHVFGLMSKAPDNTPVFPNAAIYILAVDCSTSARSQLVARPSRTTVCQDDDSTAAHGSANRRCGG